jgi:hypothetical protein
LSELFLFGLNGYERLSNDSGTASKEQSSVLVVEICAHEFLATWLNPSAITDSISKPSSTSIAKWFLACLLKHAIYFM